MSSDRGPIPDPFAPRAVVLLSGGLDSAVALACARRDGRVCSAISFDYGQRHKHELSAARRVAESLGVPPARHITVAIDLRAVGGSALTDASIDVPKDRAELEHQGGGPVPRRVQHAHEIPVTYVPARNLIFLSCAAGYAETIGAGEIYLGVNAVDYSGYPDCREPFLRAFEHAAMLGTKVGIEAMEESILDGGHAPALRVVSPLVHLTKSQIIRLGSELGVDFSLTHSCYDPVIRAGVVLACGHCDSCAIRRAGFKDAGVPDPTLYA